MRRPWSGLLILIATSSLAQNQRRTPVVQIVERVRDAVVNLTARQVVTGRSQSLFDNFFPELAPRGPETYSSQSLGSGVVITRDGLIVTNEHVIEGAAEISVRFASGLQTEAEVIGSDADADLALLRVKANDLAFLAVNATDDLMIGETVIAIGNPLGLESTVTVGVLSARDRTVNSPSNHRTYTDFLQTDASINPGNSGGGLVDLDGRLIGINTAIIGDAQGIGFAIPAKRVRRVVNDLQRYGQVQPAWLGFFVRSSGESRRKMDRVLGVEISEVFAGSPAAIAGLRANDQLLSANGKLLGSRDDFTTLLAQTSAGDTVSFEVAERDATRTVKVRAGRLPDNIGESLLARFVGIQITTSGQRLVVQRVLRQSKAAEVGLEAGDVLLQINGERVATVGEANRVLSRDFTRSTMLLVIQRGRWAYQLPFPISP